MVDIDQDQSLLYLSRTTDGRREGGVVILTLCVLSHSKSSRPPPACSSPRWPPCSPPPPSSPTCSTCSPSTQPPAPPPSLVLHLVMPTFCLDWWHPPPVSASQKLLSGRLASSSTLDSLAPRLILPFSLKRPEEHSNRLKEACHQSC